MVILEPLYWHNEQHLHHDPARCLPGTRYTWLEEALRSRLPQGNKPDLYRPGPL